MNTNRITLPLAAALGFAVDRRPPARPRAGAAVRLRRRPRHRGRVPRRARAPRPPPCGSARRTWAWTLAAAGHAALAVCAAATFARGADALGPLFPLGLLAILVGLVAATASRTAPRRVPAILLAGWVVSLAVGSPLVLAAAWIAVAAPGARRLAPAVAPA